MIRARSAALALVLVGVLLPTPPADVEAQTFASLAPTTRAPVGATVTLTDAISAELPEFIWTLRVPDQLQIDSAVMTSTGETCSVDGQIVVCGSVAPFTATGIEVEMTALEIGYDLEFDLNITVPEIISDDYTFVYDIIDPTIDAEVHPDGLVLPEVVGAQQPFAAAGSVINAGAAVIDDAVATLTASSGLVLDGATWGADQPCAIAGATATCLLGDLAPWSSTSVSIAATPLSVGSESVTVSVASPTAQDSPDPFPDVVTVPIDVTPPVVDLSIDLARLSFGPVGEPTLGAQITADFVFENRSALDAPNFEVTVLTEPGLEIASFSTTLDCASDSERIDCSAPSLDAGRQRSLRVRLVPTVERPLAWGAAISSSLPESSPDPSSNFFLNRLASPGPASAAASANDRTSTRSVAVGETHQFSAEFRNAGPSRSATTATITYPSDWTVQSAGRLKDGVSQPCDIEGQIVTCAAGVLEGYETGGRVTVQAVPSSVGLDQPIEVSVETALGSPTGPATLQRPVDVGIVAGRFDSDVDLEGAQVWAFGSDGSFEPISQVDVRTDTSRESFVFESLPDDTYQLLLVRPDGPAFPMQWLGGGGASRASATAVIVDGATTDIGTVPVVRFAEVTGRIFGGSMAIEGATVSLWPVGQAWLPYATTTTDDRGHYEFGVVVPDDYQVQVVPPPDSGVVERWFRRSTTRAESDVVEVYATQDARVNVTLPEGRSIFGRLTQSGASLVGGYAIAYDSDDSWLGSAVDETDNFGVYELVDLPPGEYKLLLIPPAGSGLPARWYGGSTRASAEVFDVSADVAHTDIDEDW